MEPGQAVEQWAHQIWGQAALGDRRRTRRAVTVLAAIARNVGQSLPKVAQADPALYQRIARFSRDANTPPEALAEAAFDAAGQRLAAMQGDVLAVCDTTTLSFTHRSVSDEMGQLGGPARAPGAGLFVHSCLAVAADGQPDIHGLLDQQFAARPKGKKGPAKQRPYEDKESFKWQSTLQRCHERFSAVWSRLLFVSDRESDVFEYLMALMDLEARFIVRANQSRCLVGSSLRLDAFLRALDPVDQVEVSIPRRGARPARKAQLSVHVASVTLRPPENGAEALVAVPVQAVLLEEQASDASVEPVRWLLLTSEPVGTSSQWRRVVECYQRRWLIEEFHFCWKSGGTQVESLRLQTREALERVSLGLAQVAVRLMQLRSELLESTHRAHRARWRSAAQVEAPLDSAVPRSCDAALSAVEWQLLWCLHSKGAALPSSAPSLTWALCALARLGGWMDTRHTGRPGYTALWQGWWRLQQQIETIRLAQSLPDELLRKM